MELKCSSLKMIHTVVDEDHFSFLVLAVELIIIEAQVYNLHTLTWVA